MRVLVTGATGLVGSGVLRRLDAAHDEIELIAATSSTDLRQPGVALSLFQQHAPEYVVHCAAKLGGVAAQKADPSMPVIDSLMMGAQVIDAAAKVDAKLVFISSTVVYPMRLGEKAVEAWPRQPEAQYAGVGRMKIFLEDLVDFYADKFGLKATILRPSAIYGPYDRGFAQDGHVIPDLLMRADAGEIPLTVWGDPNVVRDFVFVDDVADAVAAVIEHESWGHVLNVGSGTRTSILQLAEEVMRAVWGPEKLVALEDRSSSGYLRFDHTQPSAMRWRAVSIERAHDVLGWKPVYSLAGGLEKTLAWWRAQQTSMGSGNA